MKLDTTHLRYLTPTDWRVLSAVESGSVNHEIVPVGLIAKLAGLGGHKGGGQQSLGDVNRSISTLAKIGLVARSGGRGKGKGAMGGGRGGASDGYRLTYGGLDYLGLWALSRNSRRVGARGKGVGDMDVGMGLDTDAIQGGIAAAATPAIYSVGNQIGVGKESDIFIVAAIDADGMEEQRVLKIQRLGRVSFRKNVRRQRDYGKGPRQAGSWMQMSRLAATKEFAFMSALAQLEGLTVPRAVARDRHMIVMEFVDGTVLRSVDEVANVGGLYAELIGMIVTLASVGLIHGDFNEFNIILKERERADGTVQVVPVLIDFPQMVSVEHANAEFYFERDVQCVKRFFERRFKFVSDDTGPLWTDVKKSISTDATRRLDVEVEASGFSRKMAKEWDKYVEVCGVERQREDGDQDEDEDGDQSPGDEDADEDPDEDHGEVVSKPL